MEKSLLKIFLKIDDYFLCNSLTICAEKTYWAKLVDTLVDLSGLPRKLYDRLAAENPGLVQYLKRR